MNAQDIKKLHRYLLRRIPFVPGRAYPLRSDECCHPFFIIGSGRSGNTLLRRILYSHPDLYIPPETYVLGRAIKFFRQNKQLTWREVVYSVLAQFEFHEEFDTFGVSLRPLANSLVESSSKSRNLASILDGFYSYCGAAVSKDFKRWGDKTPLNTFCLNEILSVFPKAQFIHMVRDGCDASYSYWQSGIYQDIVSAAQRWADSVSIASRFTKKHQSQCLEIKYEDLVSDPTTTTKQICHFLDIEFRTEMLFSTQHTITMGDVTTRAHHSQVLKPISPSSIGKGRRLLSDEDKQSIQNIVDPELNRLGYRSCLS